PCRMSQNPFDQLSKQLLEELLSPLGRVELSREVLGESRFVDVWFDPDPDKMADVPAGLGILGRMAQTPCLLEPFRNALSASDLESCLLKLFAVVTEWRKRLQREQVISNAIAPHLWILSPTTSESFLRSIGAFPRDGWPVGVYGTASSFRTTVIAIHRLPETADTLWLRLLGKGRVQKRAIEKLLALPAEAPWRESALRMLASWRITIEARGQLDTEEQEVAMALSQAFLELEKEIEQRGVQQGIEQGLQQGELQAARAIARNLLTTNLSDAQIAEATGLSVAQIGELREQG
ncbi:MAG: flagellar assembly protein H, partial [Cyanobacteria bacterium J06639_1]